MKKNLLVLGAFFAFSVMSAQTDPKTGTTKSSTMKSTTTTTQQDPQKKKDKKKKKECCFKFCRNLP